MTAAIAYGDAPVSADRVGFRAGGTSILQDVSFTLESGTTTALIGPNGAGKSTMLALLAGDERPTTGTIELGGQPLDGWRPAEAAVRRSVMVQQHSVQFAYLVREIVMLGRAPHPADPERDRQLVDEAMRDADVEHLADREITTLSGGELARTAFARLLAQQAPLMMLDEPTAALDLHHTELLMKQVRDRVRDGATALVVLHDLNVAARYADRILMFDRGRLVGDGDPVNVLTAERIRAVYGQAVAVITHPVSGVPLVVPID